MTTAFVSGGSRGIGRSVSRRLAERGFTVYVGCRNPNSLASMGDFLPGQIIPVHLDLEDPSSVATLEATLRSVPLDLLINNAGIRLEEYDKNPTYSDISLWRRTFEVNLFGHISVTRALLPSLSIAPFARIVNISSLLASGATQTDTSSYTWSKRFKSMPAYSASKSAFNMWTIHLAYECRKSSISCISVHPGYTRTELNGGEGDRSVEESSSFIVETALNPSIQNGSFVGPEGEIPW